MSAYVNGELPPKTRRFIARMIDEDSHCYEAYLAQRQVQEELHRALPLVGKPEPDQLDALWHQISAEIVPAETSSRTSRPQLKPTYSLGYGLAAGFLLLLLTLPYTIGVGTANASAVPHQPQPAQLVTEEVPSYEPKISETPTAIAFYTEAQGTQVVHNDLRNTPASKTPGR